MILVNHKTVAMFVMILLNLRNNFRETGIFKANNKANLKKEFVHTSFCAVL